VTIEQFEQLLQIIADTLTSEAQERPFASSAAFEHRSREVFNELEPRHGLGLVDVNAPAQAFPDMVLGEFGVEVKFTEGKTWRTIANSVFEGTRSPSVRHIYLLFGKMGGTAEVRWGRYEDCVMHVRTSHVPRFEVQFEPAQTLFQRWKLSYTEFAALSDEEKMRYVRDYARERLKPGEHVWWLDQEHAVDLQPRLYAHLENEEKRRVRAEAALLCPGIVASGRGWSNRRGKYEEPVMYLLTYRNILCPQARDLFSAGSVAGVVRDDDVRGGSYIQRALQALEPELRQAAETLEDALFEEYWGVVVHRELRIAEWLKRADEAAAPDWKPSDLLFKG